MVGVNRERESSKQQSPEDWIDFALNPTALRCRAATLEYTAVDILVMNLISDRRCLHRDFESMIDLRGASYWFSDVSPGCLTMSFCRVPYLLACIQFWVFTCVSIHGVEFFKATMDSPAWRGVIRQPDLRRWRYEVMACITPDFTSVQIDDPEAETIADSKTMLFLMAEYLEDLEHAD